MSIHFLSPNPEQKQALEELEKLLAVLNTPLNKELKQNIRFVNSFTKALLLAGKNSASKRPALQIPNLEKPVEKITHKVHPFQPEEISDSFKQRVIEKIPPPPAPIAPMPFLKPVSSPEPSQFNLDKGVLRFNILEPQMEPLDWKIFNEVKFNLKSQITQNPSVLDNEGFLINEIKKSCEKFKLKYSDSYLKKIKYYIIKYIQGYGKIDVLMKDPHITEIVCNSYNDIKAVYNNQLLPTNLSFDTNEELDNLILNLAERYNKKLSETNPEWSLSLPDLKIFAFYNPIMGSRFTIKKQ